MISKSSYTFVLLRWVNDPLAGEFANVGVVLHSPDRNFFGWELRKTVGRLTKLFPDLDSDVFKGTLRSVDRGLKNLSKRDVSDLLYRTKDALGFARQVVPRDDSTLQWSVVGSGLTDDPHFELGKLYARFVGKYDEEHTARRSDADVWRPVREKLESLHIANRLKPKTIASSIAKTEFEHAWKNGSWHCYQPLSFDLLRADSIQEKAARWTGTMTGLQGAEERFKAIFVVGAPHDKELQGAYEGAIELLKRSPADVEVFEENQVNTLVDQLEDELRAHDDPA